MIAKGFIEKKEKGDKDNLKQVRLYENAVLQRNNMSQAWVEKMVYYGLTDKATPIIRPLAHELIKVIPEDVKREITEQKMSTTLGHSVKEHQFVEEREIKRVTDRIAELWNNPTLSGAYRDISSEVTRRVGRKGDKTPLQYQRERLSALESMIQEATKRGRIKIK